MGPPEVFIVVAIVGTITRKDEVDEVHIPVTVAVVFMELDAVYLGRIESGNQDFSSLFLIIDIAVILAVFQLIGTNDIEMRLELSA